jgi:hypothetical protein
MVAVDPQVVHLGVIGVPFSRLMRWFVMPWLGHKFSLDTERFANGSQFRASSHRQEFRRAGGALLEGWF